jgi:hypothetical protein
MSSPPVRLERRVGQRFSYLLPLSLRQPATALEGMGFTQDLSSRGVFFFTDAALSEGSEIEITLRMPSEITLGESMPVRCRGRILRVVKQAAKGAAGASPVEAKIGVAVRLDGYEYLHESESSNFPRVSSLHPQRDGDRPQVQSSARPVLG